MASHKSPRMSWGPGRSGNVFTKFTGALSSMASTALNEMKQSTSSLLNQSDKEKQKEASVNELKRQLRTLYNFKLANTQQQWKQPMGLIITTCTYNVASRLPNQFTINELVDILGFTTGPTPDIVGIGLQEVDMTAMSMLEFSKTERHRVWEQTVDAALQQGARMKGAKLSQGTAYVRVCSLQLVGVMLIVYVRQKHYNYVQNKRVMVSRTGGALGIVGNKGGIACRFSLYTKRFLFLTTHFPPHQKGTEKRNAAYYGIMSELKFQFPPHVDDLLDLAEFQSRVGGRDGKGGRMTIDMTAKVLPAALGEHRRAAEAADIEMRSVSDPPHSVEDKNSPTTEPPHHGATSAASGSDERSSPAPGSGRRVGGEGGSSPIAMPDRTSTMSGHVDVVDSADTSASVTTTSSLFLASRHDYIFWFGDLNYRIDMSDAEVRKRCGKDDDHDMSKEDFEQLLSQDQLLKGQRNGDIFHGFIEPHVTFRPTYKYDFGSCLYDTSPKNRIPSWTDRCLHACPPADAKTWTDLHRKLTANAYIYQTAAQIAGEKKAAALARENLMEEMTECAHNDEQGERGESQEGRVSRESSGSLEVSEGVNPTTGPPTSPTKKLAGLPMPQLGKVFGGRGGAGSAEKETRDEKSAEKEHEDQVKHEGTKQSKKLMAAVLQPELKGFSQKSLKQAVCDESIILQYEGEQRAPYAAGIDVLEYCRGESVLSDHRPVRATYRVNAARVKQQEFYEVLAEIKQIATALEKRIGEESH